MSLYNDVDKIFVVWWIVSLNIDISVDRFVLVAGYMAQDCGISMRTTLLSRADEGWDVQSLWTRYITPYPPMSGYVN
jgi:hypothetical protein